MPAPVQNMLMIPNDMNLAGTMFVMQSVALVPMINPLNAAASNALVHTIGS